MAIVLARCGGLDLLGFSSLAALRDLPAGTRRPRPVEHAALETAGLLTRGLRVLTATLKESPTAVVATNLALPDAPDAPPHRSLGGLALRHFAALRVAVTPLASVPGIDGGLRVRLTVVKHKLGVGGGWAAVDLVPGRGLDREEELARLALAAGLLVPGPYGVAYAGTPLGGTPAAIRLSPGRRPGALGRHQGGAAGPPVCVTGGVTRWPTRRRPSSATCCGRRRHRVWWQRGTGPRNSRRSSTPSGRTVRPSNRTRRTAAGSSLRAGKRAPALATRAAALLATAHDWGYHHACLGVAPTPGVARLAAHHGAAAVLILTSPAAVAAFLASLPLGGVGLGADQRDRLALVGLRTLGDVAALRRGALGDYLGVAGLALEALARGADDRPLVLTRPPLVLAACRELDWALDDRAQLARLLDALLAPLLARLRRQGLGATRATLALGGGRGQTTRHTVALARPTTAVGPLRTALLAALPTVAGATTDEATGIIALAVELVAPRPLVGRQASFFDVPQGRGGLLHAGLREARRRSDAALGHLRLVDPGHPLLERRYALGELALDDDGEAAR